VLIVEHLLDLPVPDMTSPFLKAPFKPLIQCDIVAFGKEEKDFRIF